MKEDPNSDLAYDALNWGSSLNQAGWAGLNTWRDMGITQIPPKIFNNVKPFLRAGILKYLELCSSSVKPAAVYQGQVRNSDDPEIRGIGEIKRLRFIPLNSELYSEQKISLSKPMSEETAEAMCSDFHSWSEWPEYKKDFVDLIRKVEAYHEVKG